jgi:hypothetical protein
MLHDGGGDRLDFAAHQPGHFPGEHAHGVRRHLDSAVPWEPPYITIDEGPDTYAQSYDLSSLLTMAAQGNCYMAYD